MTPAMLVHVGAGSLGIVFGAAAVSVRKGEALHRAFGKVFFLSMLTAAALGAYLGLVAHRGALLVGGILAFYMMLTAWMTVRRPTSTIGWFERVAPIGAFAVAMVCAFYGWQAVHSPMGHFQGIPAPAYFGQALVAGLAAILDVKMIVRGGIAGVPRIARHVWRVCLAFFEATSAFFIGQQKVMPVFMHGSPVLVLLGVAPLLVMAVWLLRLWFTKWYQGRLAYPS